MCGRTLFEPFFTTKEKDKGSGFGLSTVYGIVKQSGGHIWVYSEPGHGAAFKIYLPDVQVPAQHPRQAVAALPRRGSETVLLVEDDAPLRTLTRRLLEQLGYRVERGRRCRRGHRRPERGEGRVDLLLTDFVLAQLRGPELARQLRRIRPGLKVLYMSGYSESLVADAAKHPVASRLQAVYPGPARRPHPRSPGRPREGTEVKGDGRGGSGFRLTQLSVIGAGAGRPHPCVKGREMRRIARRGRAGPRGR